MVNLDFTDIDLQNEVMRITSFIAEQTSANERIVLGLSGGIDSDVTARLCVRVVGSERIKLFIVLQENFEDKYLINARQLANDLGVDLIELPLGSVPRELITIMASADPAIGFRPDVLLDVSRSKCSLRTFVYSAYVERGHIVAGTSNRTEIELGYYLPLGDGLAHFSPIAHLYKTQVQQLAQAVGTRHEVITQQPAAGFWEGDSDLEGIAYWLYNQAPIQIDLELTNEQEQVVQAIHQELSFRAIDTALLLLSKQTSIDTVVTASQLSMDTVLRLKRLREVSAKTKNRPLKTSLF